MKATLEAPFQKEFKPIGIHITIEHEEELLGLWHRLNGSWANLNKFSFDETVPYPPISDQTFDFWKVISELVEKNGLKEK